MCDPCLRKGGRLVLPPGFYDSPPVAAALGEYDFGIVFRAIRAEAGLTQRQLGDLLGMEQGRISDIERGTRQLIDIRLVSQVATKCGIAPVKLGFGAVTVGETGGTGRKGGSWMDRRDFVGQVAGLALGLVGSAGVDTDRLLGLLPEVERGTGGRIGTADVEIIEQVTSAFRSQDFSHGSGPICDAATAQLRAVLPLLDSQMAPDLRPRLQLAVADLATQAGWMSFDLLDHDAARRLWMIALDLAHAAEHPRGDDLSVYLLGDMALQSLHLGRPDEALHLVRVGQTTADGPGPVSPTTSSLFGNIRSQVYAALGDRAACDRAQGQAVEQLADADPATAPPWTAYVAHVGINGGLGAARCTLAVLNTDQRDAARAVPLLREAVGLFGSGHAKLGAWCLPNLAAAHALAGDLDTALATGHDAVDAVAAVSSPLVRDRVRVLTTALKPMSGSPGVQELSERLTAAA